MIPLGHRILVKKAKLEERDTAFAKARAAGIVLAPHEDSKRREAGVDRGWVVAVGPDHLMRFTLMLMALLTGLSLGLKKEITLLLPNTAAW